jgi:twitching motility protein PilT
MYAQSRWPPPFRWTTLSPKRSPATMSTDQFPLLGRIAVTARLITQDQLLEALQAQDHLGSTRRLGDILLELGYISQAQLDWLLQAQATMIERHRQAEAEAQRRALVEQERLLTDSGSLALPPDDRSIPAGVEEAPASPLQAATAFEPELHRILAAAMHMHASDLHIHAGLPIELRIAGRLLRCNMAPLEPGQAESLVLDILSPSEREHFAAHNDLDFAYVLPGVGRFRGNVYRQRRGIDAVFRPIPLEPPTLEDLGLPSTLARLTTFHQGLVLVTGPAGCGKSSTLAALINLINEDRPDHIITVEDPIEFAHVSKHCVVNQRQVRKHTGSFASALRAALREDPDVIAIGELRDLETISLAITAAETGHLVFGTLHTNDAGRTINRILDAYPPDQQSQIRAMISESLRAIVSQRLVPSADGARRIPVLEVLFVNIAVSNLIREERVHQLRSVMQTGRHLGMCLFDDSLLELVRAGAISKETARRHCQDPKLLL